MVARLVIPEYRRRSCFLQTWRRPIFYVDTPKAAGRPCDGGNTATAAAGVGGVSFLSYAGVICGIRVWTPRGARLVLVLAPKGPRLIHLERRCET